MEIGGMLQVATNHVKFIVKHGQKNYEVDICHTVSCSCPDRRPCHCKHVVWVLLFVLNAKEDDPIMQERRPTKEMLAQILGIRASYGQLRQTSTLSSFSCKTVSPWLQTLNHCFKHHSPWCR